MSEELGRLLSEFIQMAEKSLKQFNGLVKRQHDSAINAPSSLNQVKVLQELVTLEDIVTRKIANMKSLEEGLEDKLTRLLTLDIKKNLLDASQSIDMINEILGSDTQFIGNQVDRTMQYINEFHAS